MPKTRSKLQRNKSRKKRGGRISPGSPFWRIYTETPASYAAERLTGGGYPKPKTKENINKLVDFCKKNVVYGRLESNFSKELIYKLFMTPWTNLFVNLDPLFQAISALILEFTE